MRFTFDAELWRWDVRQEDGWVFVTLPPDATAEIRDLSDRTPRRGFGSVKVQATLGGSRWSTSIFPGQDGYALPIKKAVRRAEDVEVGDTATVTVEVVD